MEKFFKLSQNKTNFTTEVIAGFTTFFTMAYIIFVNPQYMTGAIAGMETGMDANSVMVATCLAAAFGTLLIGLLSNYPFAQAPGMGLNAFFLFTMIAGVGMQWQGALAIIFIAGIIFIIITATGFREKLFKAIPASLKFAITAGIGLFIASLGLKNGGIVSSSLLLGDLSAPATILTIVGLIITLLLMARNVKGGILIGIAITTIIGLFIPDGNGGTVSTAPTGLTWDSILALIFFGLIILSVILMGITKKKAFKITTLVFGACTIIMLIIMLIMGQSDISMSGTFFQLDFGKMFVGDDVAKSIITFITLLICLVMMDMFDTMGTVIGTAEKAGYLDKDGNLPRLNKTLYADAIATSVGALFGTSTVTTYVESVSGVNEGGRTGLTSVVVAILFVMALVFTPIAGMVPSAATAPALIIVGVLMASSMKKIEWTDFTEAAPAFVTIILMPLTSSITDGIGWGFITYCLCKLASGKGKSVSGIMYGIAIIFVIYYVLKATVLG